MFPAPAGDFDLINIEIIKASRVSIYITDTLTYSDPETSFVELSEGDKYSLKFPNTLFITVVSGSI